jgi:hypothetical protein
VLLEHVLEEGLHAPPEFGGQLIRPICEMAIIVQVRQHAQAIREVSFVNEVANKLAHLNGIVCHALNPMSSISGARGPRATDCVDFLDFVSERPGIVPLRSRRHIRIEIHPRSSLIRHVLYKCEILHLRLHPAGRADRPSRPTCQGDPDYSKKTNILSRMCIKEHYGLERNLMSHGR